MTARAPMTPRARRGNPCLLLAWLALAPAAAGGSRPADAGESIVPGEGASIPGRVDEADSLRPTQRPYVYGWPAPGRKAPVRSLTIRRDNIFGRDDPQWDLLYARLANALHVRTTERTVRGTLLFREGDSVGVADLETAIRRLRAQPFLSGEIDLQVDGDAAAVDLTVHTRDVWSTRPELRISDSGGLLEWSLGLRESNLLGLGKEVLVEAGREERDDFWGCGYSDPRL
ncbi:MAG: hypothetical protein V1774_06645, partial [Candidatus Eisenbacteria bacterium]